MAEKTKSSVLAKFKRTVGKSWNKSRKTEAQARGQSLPPGIRNGVAKLSSYKIDETQNGDPYFALTGTVVEPEDHEGRKATVTHFINDSEWATAEECLERLISDLKLLGVEGLDEADIDDLEELIKSAVDEEKHFYFNTAESGKKKQVRVYIQGPAEDFDNQDDKKSNKKSDKKNNKKEAEPEPDEPTEDDDGGDWEPAKGEVYGYTYKDGKKKKTVAVVVDKVRKKDQTVDIHVEDDEDTTFEEVEWSDLETAPE